MNPESISRGRALHDQTLRPGSHGAAAGIAASSALRSARNSALRDLWRRARACGQYMSRLSRLCLSRRRPRRLRLCESLPLGERRFVAVVEFERSRFLLGGTSASLVLLARLGSGGMDEPKEEEAVEKNERRPSVPADPSAETAAEGQR